jgi:hypothetical protein
MVKKQIYDAHPMTQCDSILAAFLPNTELYRELSHGVELIVFWRVHHTNDPRQPINAE